MTDDKRQKMLGKVRGLLAKAADATVTPAEADAFRQKADELMTVYAIEQWMVDQAEDARGKRPVPEKRMLDFEWWRRNPFASQLWVLFGAVARHCRCQPVSSKLDYGIYQIPVFGIASDLDWFDMLFTSLMMQMIQQIDPQPRKELTLNENLAMMREAGMEWRPAIERIIKLGETEDYIIDSDTVFEDVYEPWVHGYRRWCRKTGHSQSYVNQRTFRKNFAEGFTSGIRARLRDMAQLTEDHYSGPGEAGTMALAVRDIRQVIQEAVWAEYPDLAPHPSDCDCDTCHAGRCRDPKCQRQICIELRKPVRYRSIKQEKIDWAGRNAGRDAAAKADLSNNPARRVGKTPELGS